MPIRIKHPPTLAAPGGLVSRSGRPFPTGMNIPPRSLRSLPPGGLVSRSGRPFPTDMRRTGLAAVLAAVLLSACAPPISQLPPVAGRPPADFPEQAYRQAAAQGRTVFHIDAASSLVTIEVYRGGSLARLGHDHVVASHDAQGYVLPDAGNADLYVELDRLVVDEPALRAEAHFDTKPSPEDIAGTRRNMLGSGVLDAARYPFARVHVAGVGATGDARAASVSITLHGMTRAMQVPLRIETSADEMTVSGQLTLRQTDFGIAPLSVLGGAIQVKDAIDLSFRLHARPLK